jgi:hypothetical protein
MWTDVLHERTKTDSLHQYLQPPYRITVRASLIWSGASHHEDRVTPINLRIATHAVHLGIRNESVEKKTETHTIFLGMETP